MAKLPPVTNTTKYLLEYAQPDVEWNRRDYLSMSGLANECDRVPWFSFRWAVKRFIPVRNVRIFERGDIEEERVVRDLKKCGLKVFKVIDGEEIEMTGKIGELQEELVGFAGHAKGHPDGRVLGLPESPDVVHLLEIKTMADKYWKQFVKLGIEKSHPIYFGQMIKYMGHMKLKRGLIVATNKDTEERHYERINFSKDKFAELQDKERELIIETVPPVRMFERTWWKCKTCSYNTICHDNAAPDVNCRTCKFVELDFGGKWICGKDKTELSTDMQIAACKKYKRGF